MNDSSEAHTEKGTQRLEEPVSNTTLKGCPGVPMVMGHSTGTAHVRHECMNVTHVLVVVKGTRCSRTILGSHVLAVAGEGCTGEGVTLWV